MSWKHEMEYWRRLQESMVEVERVAKLVAETQPNWSGHLLRMVEAVRDGYAGDEPSAAPEAARTTVWQVANKTSSLLFATEDDARRYVSSFSASVGGGMHIYELDVCRVPLPQRSSE